jgi:hypothetical protein
MRRALRVLVCASTGNRGDGREALRRVQHVVRSWSIANDIDKIPQNRNLVDPAGSTEPAPTTSSNNKPERDDDARKVIRARSEIDDAPMKR